MPKRVYIAGALNGDAVSYIQNMHRMIIWAEKIRHLGYAVYIPCLDFMCGIVHGNWVYEQFHSMNQPWLDVSDAVFLVPGWEDSDGTKREIARAAQNNIPVFDSMIKLNGRLSKDIK